VGKTGLITRLAQEFPLEVISLDSRQVYQGLKIGTAQPTPEELAAAPHHLVDFLSPRDKYSAMRYREAFSEIYLQIRQRGGVPILVGGAGMYLTALRQGFMEIPGSTPEALAEIRGKLELLSDHEIRKKLGEVDPQSAADIHHNDRYRSQRALEVFYLSGQPMSQLKSMQKPDPCLGLDFPTVVLERKVPELDGRIAQRTDQMLKNGWIEEAEAALVQYPADSPGLKTIGYAEIVQYLSGKLSRQTLDPAIILVTRQYAKRQRTWFRHIPAELRGHPDSDAVLVAMRRLLAI
jgi:tRNA dimethylallyltransferase